MTPARPSIWHFSRAVSFPILSLFRVEFPKRRCQLPRALLLTTCNISWSYYFYSSHKDSWSFELLYRKYLQLRTHVAPGAKDGVPCLLLLIFSSIRLTRKDRQLSKKKKRKNHESSIKACQQKSSSNMCSFLPCPSAFPFVPCSKLSHVSCTCVGWCFRKMKLLH